MRKWIGATVTALTIGIALPGEAAAQEWGPWRFDLGIKGGFGYFTPMLDDDAFGENTDDLKFESGWLAGAEATAWFTDRIGLRGNFAYTERPLVLGSFDELDDDESTDVAEDINIWHGTGDLMFRLGNPENARFTPYLALGAGATWINPAVKNFNDGDGEGLAFNAGNGFGFVLEKDVVFTGLAALGGDIRLGRNIALRLEVGDRIFDAPLHQITVPATGAPTRVTDGDVGRWTNEIYGTLGLQFLMGVRDREIVAVAPAPPPPAPAPPPAPREEAITVCVVDPSSPTGLSIVSATYLPATRDTMVTINGQRQRLARPTGLMLASEADWYVRGEPLAFNVGKQRMEYVTYGTSRLIEANDLAFVGVIRGVPVYANANDVADVREELSELRAAVNQNKSFEQLLEERTELREELDDLEVVYVPLQPTGCVFQGLQRVQEVRKVRGK